MLFKVSRAVSLGASLLMASGSAAYAFGPFGLFNECCPPPTCCAPLPCVQAVVVQPAYTQVPVVEMQAEKRTVMVDVPETVYENREVTMFRPVTEQRTVQVPRIQYQTVQEMRPVTQEMGRWVTSYQANPRVTPCEYDSRSNIFGALNRASYSVRMAFTPQYTAHRHFQSNCVTALVPHSRVVAVPTSETVAYNVTRMEPYKTTQRVAVVRTRKVAQEITVQTQRTVMKTVPTGTAYAFGGGYPMFDSAPVTATASSPTPLSNDRPTRTASRDDETTIKPRSNSGGGSSIGGDETIDRKESGGSGGASSHRRRTRDADVQPANYDGDQTQADRPGDSETLTTARKRSGNWIARRTARPVAAPELFDPSTMIASSDSRKSRK
jgi:hypothetical protein